MASQRYKSVAVKSKAWEAAAAHRECSEATSRRGEAMEMAGHVRRLGGARSLELGKETVVRAIRVERGWCKRTRRRARTRRTRWCGGFSRRQLNGGSSERRS
jgi:hypothetical protein